MRAGSLSLARSLLPSAACCLLSALSNKSGARTHTQTKSTKSTRPRSALDWQAQSVRAGSRAQWRARTRFAGGKLVRARAASSSQCVCAPGNHHLYHHAVRRRHCSLVAGAQFCAAHTQSLEPSRRPPQLGRPSAAAGALAREPPFAHASELVSLAPASVCGALRVAIAARRAADACCR